MIYGILNNMVNGVESSLQKVQSWFWSKNVPEKRDIGIEPILPLENDEPSAAHYLHEHERENTQKLVQDPIFGGKTQTQVQTNYIHQLGKGAVVFGAGVLGYLGLIVLLRGAKSNKDNGGLQTLKAKKIEDAEIKLYGSSASDDFHLRGGSGSLKSLGLFDGNELTPISSLATGKGNKNLLARGRSLLMLSVDDFDFRKSWNEKLQFNSLLHEKKQPITQTQSKEAFKKTKSIFNKIQESYLDKQQLEFQVNTYTSSDQMNPSVANLKGGGFVVVWQSMGQDGDGFGIYGQRFDDAGSKVGNEFKINTNSAYNQVDPVVSGLTGLNGDEFAVIWSSGSGEYTHNICGRRYNINGSAVSDEFVVATGEFDDHAILAISSLRDNGFVVIWLGEIIPDNICGQRYDALGDKVGDKFYKSASGTSYFSLDHLIDGGFVIVWDNKYSEVYGVRYNIAGNVVGSEFQVNAYTADEQRHPVIGKLKDGGFVVVWSSNGQDGSSWGIYGQLYDSTCNKIGNEFQVNLYTLNEQSYPSVTGLSNGDFLVVWNSYNQDTDSYGIYGRRYNDTGYGVSDEFQVNVYSVNEQMWPVVSNLTNNRFVVVWQSNGQDGNAWGIYGRICEDVCTNVTLPIDRNTTEINNYNLPVMATISGIISVGLFTMPLCLVISTLCSLQAFKKKRNNNSDKFLEEISAEDLSNKLKNRFASEWLIPYKNIRSTQFLAAGGGGAIFKAQWESVEVVYKLCKLRDDEEIIKQFIREVKIMLTAKHPNIMQAFGVCVEPCHIGIVMEFMPIGSLTKILHDSNVPLAWSIKWNLSYDIAVGLNYLHDKEVIHRDLKSENVLIYEKDSRLIAKIADFGLSKQQVTGETIVTSQWIGTFQYIPPELFSEAIPIYTKKGDIYSLGVIFWEMVTGKTPFAKDKNPMTIPVRVATGKLQLPLPKKCPPSYAALMKRCWSLRTDDRPTAQEIVDVLQQNKDEVMKFQNVASLQDSTTEGKTTPSENKSDLPDALASDPNTENSS